jgi:hypothetical protein
MVRWSVCRHGSQHGHLVFTYAGKWISSIVLSVHFLCHIEPECRWGYHDINETKEQVQKMREADIPLEGEKTFWFYVCMLINIPSLSVMWNDIDLYRERVLQPMARLL